MKVFVLVALVLFVPAVIPEAAAHCDWVDGPVVVAGRRALEKGDVTPLLRWVPAADEQEIRDAFAATLQVREGGAEARAVADRWFLETLVRVHRTSEGEPYTGLRGADYRPDPGIQLADEAIASGSLTVLEDQLVAAFRARLRERFAGAKEAAAHADHNVEAGRESVRTYADFVHFVEGLHKILSVNPGQAHQH